MHQTLPQDTSQSFRLFLQFKCGKETAFSAIYVKYYKTLVRYGSGFINDGFSVESIVQEAFLRLWQNRERMESPDHIFYFAKLVVKRECLTRNYQPKYRFHQHATRFSRYEDNGEHLCGQHPESEQAEKELLHEQERLFGEVKKVMPLLSPYRRKVLQLCLDHNFRYKEIAEKLCSNVPAVSAEVRQAIKEVSEIMTKGKSLANIESPQGLPKKESSITAEQSEILSLRYESSYSFERIASVMDLPRQYVQKEFIAAYKLSKSTTSQGPRLNPCI